MKRKIIILLSLIVVLAGCGLASATTSPKRVVEDLFGKYQSLDKNVTNQLNDVIAGEKLTANQQKDYESLMRKQYQHLTYKINNETVDGDKAIVIAEIEVYNYGKVIKDADSYLAAHQNEFLDAKGKLDNAKYEDYKISKLKVVTDRVKYTLNLGLTKKDSDWKLNDLTDAERQEIHGLYTK